MAVAIDPTIGEYWRNFAALTKGADTLPPTDQELLHEALEAATDELPRDGAAWLAFAESSIRALQFAQAERALRQVVSLDSDNGRALYLLAFTQGKLGMARQAQFTAARAVRARPKDTESWYLMGLLYTDSQQYLLAAEAFEKVVALDPRHPNAWMNLARSWKAAGDTTKSRIAFRKYQDATR